MINWPISNTLDFNAELDILGPVTLANLMKDICANPGAEDAEANFLNISAKFKVPQLEIGEKVQDYTETVCGWEKSQYDCNQGWCIPDLEDVGGSSLSDICQIPTMFDVIQDIQENSKDWKCKYPRTTKIDGLHSESLC